MSWLDRVRQSIPFIAKRETPDNLWSKCVQCGEMIFRKEYEENQMVCPKCGHHGRIGPQARFAQLFDNATYTLLPRPEVREDPLKFRDSKPYTARLKAARAATGEGDALVNARGSIEGLTAVIGVQDFAFMGGSMGLGVGAAFLAGVEAAIAARAPYIIFTAAGGARMQEGILSLMQMPRTTVGIQTLREAGLPYIVVMTDPTTGGVTASYAMLGDVQLAEPGALIGFAGQRVIESTIREKLPDGFQRAEYLLEHGMLDMVTHRHELRATLARLIGYLQPSPRRGEGFDVPDHAVSSSPAVQAQLDRLATLSPGADILGLDRITRLLARLGDPHLALPPLLHVAGTNGKGSTCAFLRAGIEAAGLTCHVYTSPHLVRFNERIRLAGRLIADDDLAALLARVLDVADGIAPSFFEVTTAAAFLAFAETPADACIVEVGLGGRLDATNVLAAPVVCGISQLGIDHQFFLGDRLEDIAAEKAGIAKRGVPLVTQRYTAPVAQRVGQAAADAGARWLPRGGGWDAVSYRERLRYRDKAGAIELPLPRLPGAHQATNAALAVAMLRHQSAVAVPDAALRAAMGWAEWPARLQRLAAGPLHDTLPAGSELWLDGGHNPAAARAVADWFRGHVPAGRPFHIVLGLLANKDPAGVLRALAGRSATIHAVPVPGHEHHTPAALAAAARAAGLTGMAAEGVAPALGWIARHADRAAPPVVLVMGSLYLAGAVLAANGQLPD